MYFIGGAVPQLFKKKGLLWVNSTLDYEAEQGRWYFSSFAVGTDLDWDDHWASERVFAQVEPITQNKLGLPLFSLLRSSSLSSSLWYEMSFENRVISTTSPSLQINRLVMAIYPEYKSHYTVEVKHLWQGK